jgi:hypothetical protein
MNRYYLLMVVVFGAFLALSCSGSSTGPLTPDLGQTPPELDYPNSAQSNGGNARLMGFWEIHIDTVNETAEAVPLRDAMYTCNINEFVDGPPWNLLLEMRTIDTQPGYVDIPMEVGLQHPFPGADTFTGFDVLGVFMGDGSVPYPGIRGMTMAGPDDQQLKNADGWTRWFNVPEFRYAGHQLGLFGYDPGKAGTPDYTPTAHINPYKYFTDGLGVEDIAFNHIESNPQDRGKFSPGNTNWRLYDLRFPDAVGIKFQYAVIAHWEEHALYPNPPRNLDDFPPEANADEACVISVTDQSTLYWIDDSHNGGNVRLNISPWDWSETLPKSSITPEYVIKCFSDAWTGEYAVDMNPVGGNDNYSTFYTDIPVETIPADEPLPVWIQIEYPELDYSNRFGIINNCHGILASFFRYDVGLTGEIPPTLEVTNPNGGEVLTPGTNADILWNSYNVTGTVFIEYSKDNFVSDVNLIAADEANDGSYTWAVPNDPSTTVKVRVSSTDDPTFIYDVSDANFTILDLTPWILVEDPNGGEQWTAGSSEEIAWDSYNITGTVFIEYSKDNFVSDVNTVATGETNDGSYMWTVPFDPSTTVRVRVSSTDNPAINDTSDADFEILGASITVTYPDGGENFQTGCDYTITWTSQNASGTVFLEYSKDNFGSDIHTIATGETDDGSYLWQSIPNDLSTTVRVRVSLTIDPSVNDVSDGNFSIVGVTGRALTWGDTGGDDARYVAVDSSGNVYITGVFRNTVDFDPGNGVVSKTSAGGSDVYLAKYNACGQLDWAQAWGAASNDEGLSVIVDSANGVYVCGTFKDTVDFDPGSGTENHSANGVFDVFLSKFDSNGNFQWVGTWGGILRESAEEVGVDSSNNVYVTGYFEDTVDFDPGGGSASRTSAGGPDAYISKFNSSGAFQWVRTWGASGGDNSFGLEVTSTGDVYSTGQFLGTVDFDPGAGSDSHTSTGTWLPDAFITKFDTSGNHQWAQTWGSDDFENGIDVTVYNNTEVYCGGWFQGVCDFDPSGGVASRTSNGAADIFVSKFNSSGTFQWVQTWGGSNFDGLEQVNIDASGNLLVCGNFAGTVDMDPGGGTDNHSSNGLDDAYLVRLNSSGTFQLARTWGGTGIDVALSVAGDTGGNMFLVGTFDDTVEFAPVNAPCNDNSDQHQSAGGSDAFLVKYLSDGCW